jgi:hypothetical protein
MHRLGLLSLIFVTTYLCITNSASSATIQSFQPSKAEEIAGFMESEIFFDGEITKQSIADFQSEVETKNIETAKVYLNSSGGDLLAGIKLGLYMRKKGFSTDIGTFNPSNKNLPEAGKCLSACVLSYAGGYYRYASEQDLIGVHRFYTNKKTEHDIDIAQVLSAAIVNHLQEMGVNTRLFDLMTIASGKEIYILSEQEAESLNLVNNGVSPPTWTLETAQGLIYLKGEQKTGNGIGKFILMCGGNGKVLLNPFYEAGYNKETIATTSVRYSLRINGDFLPLDKPLKKPQVSGDYVAAEFSLDRENIRKIIKSREVGFAFHPHNPDLFWGFLIKPVDTEKIKSFLVACGAI